MSTSDSVHAEACEIIVYQRRWKNQHIGAIIGSVRMFLQANKEVRNGGYERFGMDL